MTAAKQGSPEAPEVLPEVVYVYAEGDWWLTASYGPIRLGTRFVRGEIAEGLLDLLVRCRATHGLGKFLDEDVAAALNAGFKE